MLRACPKCGALLKDVMMFCVSCGMRQAMPEPSQYTQQPPAHHTQQPLILGDESSRKKPFFFFGAIAIAFIVIFAAIGLAWWLVALLTVAGVFLNFARMYAHGRIIAGRTWQCPNCSVHFKFFKWYNYFFVPTINKSYKIRVQCPQCNAKVWCGNVRNRFY